MEREKIVISGINGFVGHHLAKELKKSDKYIVGIGQNEEVNPKIKDIVDEYFQENLTQNWPAITNVKTIIHLAGLSAVGKSFEAPQAYINSNSAMLTNMCEYYIKQDDKPRIIIASSGTVYSPNQPLPITEDGELAYSSPYVVSKMLNENQAAYYRNRGLDCIVVRPFNHIGPDQDRGFILPDFYNRLSTLDEGEDTISVGNIETYRDFTDVRDIVRAYGKIALAITLKHNVYNICSGVSLSGVEIFNKLKSAMDLPNVKYEINQSLVRPTDIKNIVGDSSRLKDELSWEPQIDINQTIIDFVKSQS